MLRTLVFFSLITSAYASLDDLVDAAQSFAAAIDQQITTDQSDPSPTDFAEKTIAYADAIISYYNALRAAMPELTNVATGREPRPQEVDKFRDAFRGTGEIPEMVADRETAALLERFSGDPEVQKAAAEFAQTQKLEETFLKDFEGQDFTSRSPEDESSLLPTCRLRAFPILLFAARKPLLRDSLNFLERSRPKPNAIGRPCGAF